MEPPIRVVLADDSPFVCHLMRRQLEEAGGIEVIGVAHDGAATLAMVRQLRPHVLTLDLEMGDMNGLEILRDLMRTTPLPVVIVSGVSGRAAAMTLQAIDDGAVDFVLKFNPEARIDPEALRAEIVSKVRAAARLRVVRSLAPSRLDVTATQPIPLGMIPVVSKRGATWRERVPGGVVVIGASTGGPVALRQLLGVLAPDFPAAVLVVQHMPASFTGVLAAQLNYHVALEVREASEEDTLAPGTVYVAPGGFHLLLEASGRLSLSRGPEIKGHRPAIDITMQAVAQLAGPVTQGVVLSGMGEDGVEGLLAIRSRGGQTYAQDPASCVVDGMPQRALERRAAAVVAEPVAIGHHLATHARGLANRTGSFGAPPVPAAQAAPR